VDPLSAFSLDLPTLSPTMVPMGPRGWTTVALTTIASPAGSIGGAVWLGRGAQDADGGMAVLAAVVIGIWLGGPVLSLVVYLVCQSTLLRRRVAHPWRAFGVMVLAVVAELGVVLLGIVVVAGAATTSTEVLPVIVAAAAVLAVGAVLALLAGGVTERVTAPTTTGSG